MLLQPEAQTANIVGNTVSPLKGASVVSAIACQVLMVATSGPRVDHQGLSWTGRRGRGYGTSFSAVSAS
eukprot:8676212-Heterocapsa_arctica.AAC.1